MEADYNYAHFTPSTYDLAAFDGPRVGEQLPDLTLTTPDGQPCRLADFYGRTLVIETGSVTCPMYAKNVAAMTDVARRHPEVAFVVLYVREAHPGERIGPHVASADKTAAAGLLNARYGEQRIVLVDDLQGTAHHRLGLLPNVVYIVDAAGCVVFRGDWNAPSVVEEVLAGTAAPKLINQDHFPPARPGPRIAMAALLAGGRRAVWDFVVGLPELVKGHRRADRALRPAKEMA